MGRPEDLGLVGKEAVERQNPVERHPIVTGPDSNRSRSRKLVVIWHFHIPAMILKCL